MSPLFQATPVSRRSKHPLPPDGAGRLGSRNRLKLGQRKTASNLRLTSDMIKVVKFSRYCSVDALSAMVPVHQSLNSKKNRDRLWEPFRVIVVNTK